jgi:hypothetical protein
MATTPPNGSHWYCALCRVHLWLEGEPTRRRCRWCRHWLVRKR